MQNGSLSYMLLNIYEKIHQFLSSIKRDVHKRKSLPFFCLTVYICKEWVLRKIRYHDTQLKNSVRKNEMLPMLPCVVVFGVPPQYLFTEL